MKSCINHISHIYISYISYIYIYISYIYHIYQIYHIYHKCWRGIFTFRFYNLGFRTNGRETEQLATVSYESAQLEFNSQPLAFLSMHFPKKIVWCLSSDNHNMY